jgi:hypothetical protein
MKLPRKAKYGWLFGTIMFLLLALVTMSHAMTLQIEPQMKTPEKRMDWKSFDDSLHYYQLQMPQEDLEKLCDRKQPTAKPGEHVIQYRRMNGKCRGVLK